MPGPHAFRVPDPNPGGLDWMDAAACGDSRHYLHLPVERQAQICWEHCTVVDACMAWGVHATRLVNDNDLATLDTVFGGLTPEQLVIHRRVVRREERRAADAA